METLRLTSNFNRREVDLKFTSDFDLRALAAALDEQRKAKGLSWSGVVSEMRGAKDCKDRSLSASTIKAIGARPVAEADGVLQMLRWLKRPAESFIAGYRAFESAQSPEVPAGKIPRFDTRSLFVALDSQRIRRRMTWQQVAIETRWPVSGLKRLSQGGRTAFPAVMRLAAWLNKPAANFIRFADPGQLPSWRTR